MNEINPDANGVKFLRAATVEARKRFADDPAYGYVASRMSPEDLAGRLTVGLVNGSADKDGAIVKAVCKELGIARTYRAIREYLLTPLERRA